MNVGKLRDSQSPLGSSIPDIEKYCSILAKVIGFEERRLLEQRNKGYKCLWSKSDRMITECPDSFSKVVVKLFLLGLAIIFEKLCILVVEVEEECSGSSISFLRLAQQRTTTRQFKATGIYSLTLLEAKYPQSSFQHSRGWECVCVGRGCL